MNNGLLDLIARLRPWSQQLDTPGMQWIIGVPSRDLPLCACDLASARARRHLSTSP